MKTHYDPFYNPHNPYEEDSSEKGYCGTLLNENYYNATNKKNDVDCKKCIKLFEKADIEMKRHHDNFANDCELFIKHLNV